MATASLNFQSLRAVFAAKVTSYPQWIIIAAVGVLFVLMPQLPNNDWQRNASQIPLGLGIYSDPAYVYPPWALLLMFPNYLLGAAGARVASVLIVGLLAQVKGWSLGQFLGIALAPLFLWTMVLSSADVLILVGAILLWDWNIRWQALPRGLALALLLLKPQVTFLLVLYWLWMLRHQPRALLGTLAVGVVITLPISLLGTPSLLLQWVANLTNPVGVNLDHWVYNNLSLTYRYGLPFALIVVIITFGALYLWVRQRGKAWTHTAGTGTALTAAMLIAPYASNQSAIVPIALHPSWRVTLLQYVLVFGTAILNIYHLADDWILLILTLLAIALSARSIQPKRE
jgi:hypothetical protein